MAERVAEAVEGGTTVRAMTVLFCATTGTASTPSKREATVIHNSKANRFLIILNLVFPLPSAEAPSPVQLPRGAYSLLLSDQKSSAKVIFGELLADLPDAPKSTGTLVWTGIHSRMFQFSYWTGMLLLEYRKPARPMLLGIRRAADQPETARLRTTLGCAGAAS